jgi:hypothetical protein
MTELEYRTRLSLFSPERRYSLGDRAISTSGRSDVYYSDIRQIRTYDAFGGISIGEFSRCVVSPSHGQAIVLSNKHFVGFANFEDRGGNYEPFVETLIDRVALANSDARFVSGMPMALWLFWLFSLAILAMVTPVSMLLYILLQAKGQMTNTGTIVINLLLLGTFLGVLGIWRKIWKSRPVAYTPVVRRPS